MIGEAAAKKVYDAASKGDVAKLHQLLDEDPHLADEASFACSRNLLHIATTCGQAAIVEEVLNITPRLARSFDAQNWSPLHIAAAEGNVEIAKKLLSAAPEMCLWRDCQGMNPIHVAAIKGHVEILEELLELNCLPAKERVHRGQTVLHLCVKHRQLRALEVLMEKFVGELASAKDDDGDTISHWAVRSNHIELIRYLTRSNKVNWGKINSMGKTPLEIFRDSPIDRINYSETLQRLMSLSLTSMPEGFGEMAGNVMVIGILIATMAFQVAVNPPGGVWQEDSSTHKAGEAVIASTHPRIYKLLSQSTTTAFVSSFITLFILSTRLLAESSNAQVISVYAMWVSMSSISVSYGASLLVITPNMKTGYINYVIGIGATAQFMIVAITKFGDYILKMVDIAFEMILGRRGLDTA